MAELAKTTLRQGAASLPATQEQAQRTFFRSFLDRVTPVSWRERLCFRQARFTDVPRLAQLYNSAWVNEKELQKFPGTEQMKAPALRIEPDMLKSQLKMFPEGQILGVRRANGREEIVSMLNTFIKPARAFSDIEPGYNMVTGSRTFRKHTPLSKNPIGWFPVLHCVSITVDPAHWGSAFAEQTLNHGVKFAEQNGLAAMPYSAPRGFGAFKLKNPDAKIEDYLHSTRPSKKSYAEYCEHLKELNASRHHLFRADYARKLQPLGAGEFEEENTEPEGRQAFLSFFERRGKLFEKEYGRPPGFADFIRLTGRRHFDPVMDLHFRNGADFIYDQSGIQGVFENSRPEDIFASGYNICLAYSPSHLFNPRHPIR